MIFTLPNGIYDRRVRPTPFPPFTRTLSTADNSLLRDTRGFHQKNKFHKKTVEQAFKACLFAVLKHCALT